MKYLKRLTVNLRHLYFYVGGASVLGFAPTKESKRRMLQDSIFFRETEQGFMVMEQENPSRPRLKDGEILLNIAAYGLDDFLPQYSNLDINSTKKQLYYLSNVKRTLKASEKKPLTITDSDTKEIFHAVPVESKPEKFPISLNNQSPGKFRLIDSSGENIRQWVLEGEGSGLSLHVAVSIQVPGYYELKKGNAVIARYFADDQVHADCPVFVLGIGLTLKAGETGNFKASSYSIEIGNRAVFWRYQVYMNMNGRKPENIVIENNNKKLTGIQFNDKSIHEGGARIVFLSSKPIPLTQAGYTGIQLKETSSGGFLVPNLPNGDMRTVKYNDDKWVSDIFVCL
jgi:hypothetical protein